MNMLSLLDEHDSPQWYDIIHFEHKALRWASTKGLIPMKLVFLTYKVMIIP